MLALVASCTPGVCGRASDCASGLVCTTAGACVVPPVDASTEDGAAVAVDAQITPIRDADGDALVIEPIDAAPADASAVDASTVDAPDDDGLAGGRR